uniref:Uncharacterized protein n=1 Tax=Pararge aegeria TaxID=116150 RepID=S4P0G5_9NEOP
MVAWLYSDKATLFCVWCTIKVYSLIHSIVRLYHGFFTNAVGTLSFPGIKMPCRLSPYMLLFISLNNSMPIIKLIDC